MASILIIYISLSSQVSENVFNELELFNSYPEQIREET